MTPVFGLRANLFSPAAFGRLAQAVICTAWDQPASREAHQAGFDKSHSTGSSKWCFSVLLSFFSS